jgi:predicted AlkP superfamily phosphohydrolase/phosphomutase
MKIHKGLFFFCLLFLVLNPENAIAYIGPGAGFAFLSSFFVLFITILLTFFLIISLPIRYLIKRFNRRRYNLQAADKRVVIIGLDGLDPTLVDRYMEEGKLPNFSRIKETGSYSTLGTTSPAISPVAWSSFATGVNPAKHNIYDFLARDRHTYLPVLSSSQIDKPTRHISVGKYKFPLERPQIKFLRKGKSFWSILSEYGISSSIIRVPVTFPPEKFNGVQLSAMCTPDIKGTQGTFTLYTTERKGAEHTGGMRIPVEFQGNRIESFISGPQNPIQRKSKELKLPISVTVDREKGLATIEVSGQTLSLKKGEFSHWVRLTFKAGFGIRIHGLCKFLITRIYPDFGLYVSPINIDPEKPALPISYPLVYSLYLSKVVGRYATLGLAEDTWALNEGILDEKDFLNQCYLNHEEREKMLFNELGKVKRGVCVCVFDITDRMQHMFWRYIDGGHPANRDQDDEAYKYVIEDLYKRMDGLIGRVLDRIDDQSILMIVSDHGFKSFRRGVNVNSWLYMNGYLSLKNGKKSSGEWFDDVDWTKTKAYALGLGGLYINQKDREAQGIVSPGKETEKLKAELIAKLSGLKDDKVGKVAIDKVMDSSKTYNGPYMEDAPDLIIGYSKGYRVSWDSVTGKINGVVFEDNKKRWSGDHCISPELVPGVFFCNQRIAMDSPHIVDIAPTVLQLFGVEVPGHMDGKPIIVFGSETSAN